MRRRHLLVAVAATALFLCPAPGFADLDEVRKDTDLQRRSRKALENADAALNRARQAYRQGDGEALDRSFSEIAESVELSYQSLVERGDNPRRNAGPYKRGELSTKQLLRRLAAFRDEMSYMDRDRIDPVIERVDKVHSEFLRDVMGGRQ